MTRIDTEDYQRKQLENQRRMINDEIESKKNSREIPSIIDGEDDVNWNHQSRDNRLADDKFDVDKKIQKLKRQ